MIKNVHRVDMSIATSHTRQKEEPQLHNSNLIKNTIEFINHAGHTPNQRENNLRRLNLVCCRNTVRHYEERLHFDDLTIVRKKTLLLNENTSIVSFK